MPPDARHVNSRRWAGYGDLEQDVPQTLRPEHGLSLDQRGSMIRVH
jgi:hypothetical protein